MDRDALDRRLAEAFGGEPSEARRTTSGGTPDGGEPAERRVVVRQALDLADSGRWAEAHDGASLTVDRVVAELEQAPEGEGLADRWNWWVGSLEVAFGDFERFAVRRWRAE